MTKILTIDTSSKKASISYSNKGKIIDDKVCTSKNNHSIELSENVLKLFSCNSLNVNDLDFISVALGPGGFTAIRVGISFAIGLSKVSLPSKNITGGDAIPEEDIFVELRINRPLETYSFRSPDSATEQTSSLFPHRVAATPLVTGYLNLPLGNDWNQAPAIAVERFDSVNLGPIATFRRVQVGSPVIHWWQATSATAWNIYINGPPTVGQAVDGTATANLATGVITGAGFTFTPTGYGATPDIVNIPVNVNLHDVMGFEVCKSELKIIPLVLIAIVLVIAGHFLMKPIFHNTLWVEYSLALLPFILILLVVWAFKIAIKNEKDNNDDRTN